MQMIREILFSVNLESAHVRMPCRSAPHGDKSPPGKEDGREYLVKREAFSGVRVISQNPYSPTRFKDMLLVCIQKSSFLDGHKLG